MKQTTVFEVAKYILQKQGPTSAMKLQKLVYYSQAWSLVWDEKPLFNESIEAWVNGPVVRELYDFHKGSFNLNEEDFKDYSTECLSETQKESIDTVLKAYGSKSAQWLSDQTHSEKPWIEARKGLSENERGNNQITHFSLAEYYGSLNG